LSRRFLHLRSPSLWSLGPWPTRVALRNDGPTGSQAFAQVL